MSSEPKYRGKLPFDIVESSVDTGYNKEVVLSTQQNIEIVNLHTDEYGHLEGSPLQGPFTEAWVGGHQHRHISLNSGSDNEQNRAEAFLIDLSPNTVKVYGANHFDPHRPRAIYSRDNLAKSPLNIKNIKTQNGQIGNFSKNYEVLQTSGRNINQSLIENNLTASGVLTTKFIRGLPDYQLPANPNIGKSVIVERFSAPGDPKESSRGSLDRNGEEYSPNNSLITRNIRVRENLYSKLSPSAPQFTNGYHGVNRNGFNRLKYVFVLSTNFDQPLIAQNSQYIEFWHVTSSVYDNFWVQHSIPATDLRYKWIADYNTNTGINSLMQYQSFAGTYNKSSAFTDITFNSSSFVTSGSNKQFEVDNAWLGSIVKDKKDINLTTNTFSIESPGVSSSFSEIINSSYGFSSWRQLRINEHPVARSLRKNNIISLEGLRTITVNNRTLVSRRADSVANFIETPVISKHKPIKEILKLKDSDSEFKFIFTHLNNKATFVNRQIIDKLDIRENSKQVYDMFHTYYTDELIEGNSQNPLSSIENLNYIETVYPLDINTYLSKTRGRTAYILTQSGTDRDGFDRQLGTQRVFWRDNIKDRQRSCLLRNSLNYRNCDIFGTNPLYGLIGLHIKSKSGTGETLNLPGSSSFSQDINYQTDLTVLDSSKQDSILAFDNNPNNSYRELLNFVSKISASNSTGYKVVATKTIDNGCSGELNSEIFVDYYYSSGSTPGAFKSQLTRVTPFTNYLQYSDNYNYSGNQEITTSYFSYSDFIEYRDININKFYFEPSYTSYTPRPNYVAFIGGFESGSRNYTTGSDYKNLDNYNFFTNQPTGIVLSTLDSGLRFDEETFKQNGKRPWFDSYEEYSEDIKYFAKDHSILPEFNISKNMPYYVSKGSNFRSNNKAFLELDGADKENYRSSYIEESGDWNIIFNKNYILGNSTTELSKIQNENEPILSLKHIKFKISGIKKLLPYNGFYPKERTIQLANLFNKFLTDNVDGGFFSIAVAGNSPNTATISINNRITQDYFAKNTVMPYFFAPGILYNTVKSGISVDFPAISIEKEQDLGLDFLNKILQNNSSPIYRVSTITNNFILNESDLRLSYLKEDLINKRIPFEHLIFPELSIPTKLISSVTEEIPLQGDTIFAEIQSKLKEKLQDILINIKFDAYTMPDTFLSPTASNDGLLGAGYKNSIPFAYLNADTIIDPSYSLAMSNFLAEIPKFFLKKYEDGQHLNVFRSKTKSEWKVFNTEKTYCFDLKIKKSPNLVMIESYNTGSNRVTGSNVLEKTANGRYFGWPVNKIKDNNNITDSEKIDQYSVHNDPAYAPFTPPYFEGESVLRFKLKPTKSVYNTVGELLEDIKLEDKYPHLEFISGSEAYKNKMSLRYCLDYLGVGINPNATQNPQGQTNELSYISDPNNEFWTISPKLETPVLDFSTQTFKEHTGSYWKSDGYGRGMWSGYGTVPNYNYKSIQLKLREIPLSELNESTGSLLQQVGFEVETKKIGQVADTKEISEAIVLIPYTNSSIQNVTQTINGFNVFLINEEIYNLQKSNIEIGQPAVKINEFGSDKEYQETSISKMIKLMKKYVIPPNFNFGIYEDIKPFAMYIFEFKHMLDQQDLADIWQSVMPKIGMNAENEIVEFGHELNRFELLGESFQIPEDLKWLVFKVKKKGEANYFAITANKNDDDYLNRYKFINNPARKTPPYSYNWPYDYFSLIEMAKIDIDFGFTKKE